MEKYCLKCFKKCPMEVEVCPSDGSVMSVSVHHPRFSIPFDSASGSAQGKPHSLRLVASALRSGQAAFRILALLLAAQGALGCIGRNDGFWQRMDGGGKDIGLDGPTADSRRGDGKINGSGPDGVLQDIPRSDLDIRDVEHEGEMPSVKCGDGVCASTRPGTETCCTCPTDCGSCCRNGACDCGETGQTCPGDCGGECVSGVSSGKKTHGPHGTVWVAIPAGCFTMGCSPGDGGCWSNENPPHEVTVSAFEMLETEVTEGQWAAVVPADPSPSCDYGGGGGANSPVECVNWDEAEAFCKALGPKGRLCTEAEWEYAARAGTTTRYYCGDDSGCFGDIAWYFDNSGIHKHDVKSGGKLPNAYGLYDMLGNVWEWVEDCWHDSYDDAPSKGYPAWTASCSISARVFRGGSFVSGAGGTLRVSSRCGVEPSYDVFYLGLRCCRSE